MGTGKSPAAVAAGYLGQARVAYERFKRDKQVAVDTIGIDLVSGAKALRMILQAEIAYREANDTRRAEQCAEMVTQLVHEWVPEVQPGLTDNAEGYEGAEGDGLGWFDRLYVGVIEEG